MEYLIVKVEDDGNLITVTTPRYKTLTELTTSEGWRVDMVLKWMGSDGQLLLKREAKKVGSEADGAQ